MKRKLLLTLSFAVLLLLAGAGILVWSGMTDHLGKADVALVLGNQVNPDGSPSPRLKARLDTTAMLFQKGYFPKIIVSGGTGKEGVPEGTAMKRYLVATGIPDSAIWVDDLGVDTQASAENTVSILRAEKLKSVFVITQYFHIPRSKLALSKLGVSPLFNAHPHYFEARDLYSIARELPAYLKYLVRSPTARLTR
ncbi:MAG: YdcF family protein [Verrucomicrobiaceae bacterium]|nr:YdcF family protein [Verrucomicrobiaceae bacterium]